VLANIALYLISLVEAFMGLLPTGYDIEQVGSSNGQSIFMKLQNGDNKFRILGLRLIYRTWGADNKPILYRAVVDGKQQEPVRLPFCGRQFDKFGKQEKWKHVWFCLVWSYLDQDLKVLEIPQATIQKTLAAYDADPDAGPLSECDIKIKKSGNGQDTEYSVMAIKSKLDKSIKEAFSSASINLDANVYGAYPNDPEWHDKALQRLIDNLDSATKEATNRGIELEIPASTDLAELQTAWERAMDAMPLQKTELPKVEAESALSDAEIDSVPF
jgi:hypothetical protein